MKKCEQEIRKRIIEKGKITFSEFMELALFHPIDGYYSSLSNIGDSGDYYTSSTAHPIFGTLIGIQLKQMWELLGKPQPFYVIEHGSGSGVLATDIHKFAMSIGGEFGSALTYKMIEVNNTEPGMYGKIAKKKTAGLNNGWLEGGVGCFISNELIDSFPVHRFEIQGNLVKEIYVSLQDGSFVEVLDHPSTSMIEERLTSLSVNLKEGFRGEINTLISARTREITDNFSKGFVITIDYGYLSEELYSNARSSGTLQCYYKHTQNRNVYQKIGYQDITTHVDFTTLINDGKSNCLEALGFVTQNEFLRNLGIHIFLKSLSFKKISNTEYLSNRMGMQDLIKPDGLGNFKVLVQSKGLDTDKINLFGLTSNNVMKRELEKNVKVLSVPLLNEGHSHLMAGRYPQIDWEWEQPV